VNELLRILVLLRRRAPAISNAEILILADALGLREEYLKETR